MRYLGDLVSSQLLPRVEQPSQYIGLELNARLREKIAASPNVAFDVTVALAFPDTYSVGISHLGGQVLYHMLNAMSGVACDRAYCPRVAAEEVMRQQAIPLFGWESRWHLGDFDILGFSLAYEICITNVLTMLDLAGIPLRSSQRRPSDPIVVGGDALADTPEPVADFFDLIIPGDGEGPLGALVQLVAQMKKAGHPRGEIILQAARTIPSIYAPGLYQPTYNADGTAGKLQPLHSDLPEIIQRAHLGRMSDSPTISRPLVPLAEAIHERVVIEIMRGCPNACRFCQAGTTRLPVRIRSVDEIVDAARSALAATGYKEISLLSLSTGDYPHLEELIDRLNTEFAPQHVSISLPSLRVGQQLQILPRLTSAVRKGGLTIAAEAGSQRLREAIRKDITEQDMIEGVQAAFAAGWRSVKVYFMAGLPGETPEDINEIYLLCRRLSDARKAVDGQRGTINASVSWFVPKPHTPMQWCAMRDKDYFLGVRRQLMDLAYRSPITFRFHRVERSLLEAVLCRGDRRVAAGIEAAWRSGARMDSWDEHFDYALWTDALAAAGVDMNFYAHRDIPIGSVLPWSHIRCYRDESFLLKEYEKMMATKAAPPPVEPPAEQ